METFIVLSLLSNLILAFLSYNSIYLTLENTPLRKQLVILKSRTFQIRTKPTERWYFILFSKLLTGWQDVIIIVQPRTVLSWHKNFLRAYWKWISKAKFIGRPEIDKELIETIKKIAKQNPLWKARRVRDELGFLGFDISNRYGKKTCA